MNIRVLSVLLAFCTALFSVDGNAQSREATDQPTMEEFFSYKEVFTYEVKYGFLYLGEVEVTLLPDTMFEGKLQKHLTTKITSNPRIPFIGTEIDHFHSFFYVNDEGIPVTSYYWRDNIDEDRYKDIEYYFDRENGEVTYKEEDDTRDTLKLVEPATAGHIIFYHSRLFAGSGKKDTMRVYVTKQGGSILFDNGTELEKRNYAAFEEPVQAYLTTGRTKDIDGPFGFSGKFRAWFKDDELRVPLEARVRVLFGNAMVRIVDYKKEKL